MRYFLKVIDIYSVSKILFAFHAQGDRIHPKYIGFTIIFNVKHFKSSTEYSEAQQNVIIVTCRCVVIRCTSQLHMMKSTILFQDYLIPGPY